MPRFLSIVAVGVLLVGCSREDDQLDRQFAGPRSRTGVDHRGGALVPPELPDVSARSGPTIGSTTRWRARSPRGRAASYPGAGDLEEAGRERQVDHFTAETGRVKHVFRAVTHGFSGFLPRGRVQALARRLGDELRSSSRRCRRCATSTRPPAAAACGRCGSRASPAWRRASPVELHHHRRARHRRRWHAHRLSGRQQGWKDYTTDNEASAVDYGGHGTHVAGIAVGTGAAFPTTSGTGTLSSPSTAPTPEAANNFNVAAVHALFYFDNSVFSITATSKATWSGGSTSLYALVSADNGSWAYFTSKAGTSPITSFAQAGAGLAYARYQPGLLQDATADITNYGVATSLSCTRRWATPSTRCAAWRVGQVVRLQDLRQHRRRQLRRALIEAIDDMVTNRVATTSR